MYAVWWVVNFWSLDDEESACSHNDHISIYIENTGACFVERSAGGRTENCILMTNGTLFMRPLIVILPM